MADGATPNYALTLIEVFGSVDTWGGKLNQNFTSIDAQMKINADAAAAATAAAGGKIPQLPTATVVGNIVTWNDIGGDTVADSGVGIANVARRNAANTFTGDQSVNGNIAASVNVSAAAFVEGGQALAAKYAPISHTHSIAQVTGLQTSLDAKSDKGVMDGLREITASATLPVTDAGSTIEVNSGSAAVVTIDVTAAWPARSRIDIVRTGAGAVTIALTGAGAALRSKNNLVALAAQWSGATLYRRSATDWVLIGDLA